MSRHVQTTNSLPGRAPDKMSHPSRVERLYPWYKHYKHVAVTTVKPHFDRLVWIQFVVHDKRSWLDAYNTYGAVDDLICSAWARFKTLASVTTCFQLLYFFSNVRECYDISGMYNIGVLFTPYMIEIPFVILQCAGRISNKLLPYQYTCQTALRTWQTNSKSAVLLLQWPDEVVQCVVSRLTVVQ